MSDAHLKNIIEKAIAAIALVSSAEIAVTTDRGLVTIYGNVGTFAERDAAEHIETCVSGTKAIVQKTRGSKGRQDQNRTWHSHGLRSARFTKTTRPDIET